MRLKLRAELLDDDALRNEFNDDLDELDMMVKGALQCVKDSDIHENPTEVRLDRPDRAHGARRAPGGARGAVLPMRGLSVTAKPLALKRAIGNLLDNALFYGQRAEIATRRKWRARCEIRIRDHGPGVPEDALRQPVRALCAARRMAAEQNAGGMGLGLGIARDIVHGHGGQLRLANHPDGGVVATIMLPA